MGSFIKVQSILIRNQLEQDYSTGAKHAIQGHLRRTHNHPFYKVMFHGHLRK